MTVFKRYIRLVVVGLALFLVVFGIIQPKLFAIDRSRELRAIYGDHVMYSDECAPQSTDSSTPTVGKVYLIGDSIAEGAAADLDASLRTKGFTDVVIDAKASRSLSEGGSDLNGLSVLANSKDVMSNANTVIIELGTNGGVNEGTIKQTIDSVRAASSSAQIYWVNVGANNGTRTSGTPIDTEGIDAALRGQANLGYSVIDWKKVVDENPGYIANDGLGVHPTPTDGRAAFVGAVVNSLGGTTSSTPQQATTSPCECSVAALLPGADNREKIWNFLVGKGLDSIQTAGVMGNLQAESGFEPDKEELSGGGGYGLAQWTGGRRTSLEQAASEQGVPVGDLTFQLNYLYDEANRRPIDRSPGYPDGMTEWEGQKQQKSVSDAVLFFHTEFEVSNDNIEKLANRVNFGETILSELGSVPAGASGNGGYCGTTASGLVVGGFTLPVDRKFYDENQNWFTKPHHDYPAADIPVPMGTPIYSMTAGTVIAGGVEPDGCGQGVLIEAPGGARFIYCHGSDGSTVPGAEIGNTVQPGQLIMHSASTGSSTGPHLHLGIRIDNKNVCPQSLFVGIIEGSVPALDTLPTSGCSY